MRRTYYRIVLTVVLAGFLAGKTVIFPAYGMVSDGDMSELSTGEDGKEDASLSPDGEGSRGEAPENSHGENGEGETPPSPDGEDGEGEALPSPNGEDGHPLAQAVHNITSVSERTFQILHQIQKAFKRIGAAVSQVHYITLPRGMKPVFHMKAELGQFSLKPLLSCLHSTP